MDALKPCPFCGCEQIDIVIDDYTQLISCHNCPCKIEDITMTEGQLIDAWNKRFSMKPQS